MVRLLEMWKLGGVEVEVVVVRENFSEMELGFRWCGGGA